METVYVVMQTVIAGYTIQEEPVAAFENKPQAQLFVKEQGHGSVKEVSFVGESKGSYSQ